MIVALSTQVSQDGRGIVADPGACGVATTRSHWESVHRAISSIVFATDLQKFRIAIQANGAAWKNRMDSQSVVINPCGAFFRIAEDCFSVSLLKRIGAEMVENVLPFWAFVGIDPKVFAHGNQVLEQDGEQGASDKMGFFLSMVFSWIESSLMT